MACAQSFKREVRLTRARITLCLIHQRAGKRTAVLNPCAAPMARNGANPACCC